jgi:hypothetical protein
MSAGSLIGTLGVTLLLVAFALNITKKISSESMPYLWLNLVGSVLACISSYIIVFWPFVILEGVWALATLFALIKTVKK